MHWSYISFALSLRYGLVNIIEMPILARWHHYIELVHGPCLGCELWHHHQPCDQWYCSFHLKPAQLWAAMYVTSCHSLMTGPCTVGCALSVQAALFMFKRRLVLNYFNEVYMNTCNLWSSWTVQLTRVRIVSVDDLLAFVTTSFAST